MSVEVINEQGGGGRIVTAFSDDFNRANNTNGFGENWTCAGLNYVAGGGAFSSIGFVGISVNQSVWQASAVNRNDIFPFGFMPIPPMSGLAGKSQFSQLTFVSTNSVVGTRSYYLGPSILNGWVNGGFRQYMAICVRDDVSSLVAINRFDGSTYANLGGTFAMADGDVIRIEGRILGGGASVDLTLKRNGVTLVTTNDAAATRSIAGSPGIHRNTYVSNAAPGTSSVAIDDFSCGKL